MEAGGIETEFLVLEYAARTREGRKKEGLDKLYVPVASLQMIHRYTGAEDETAPLHSLGSERWVSGSKVRMDSISSSNRSSR